MKTVQPIKDLRKIDELKQIVSSNPRNYLLVCFGFGAGLRIGDILKLKVQDVRGKSHIVLIESKTRKEKRFKLNPSLISLIDSYITEMNDDDFLFKSRQGGNKPITRFMAYKIIKNAANRIGLFEIGTHSLRKSLAYQIYTHTKDIGIVMTLLNHSSAQATLRYIGITQEVLDLTIDKYSI